MKQKQKAKNYDPFGPLSYNKASQQTILIQQPVDPSISSDHPLFYVRERDNYLQKLSQRAAITSKLGPHDLKRNVRVQHYVQQYQRKRQTLNKKQRMKNAFLNTEWFSSVMVTQNQLIRKRQQKQAQKLRQQLFNEFILLQNQHSQPEHDKQYGQQLEDNDGQLRNATILSLNDPNRQKQLYLLDLEINRLTFEQNLEKVIKNKHQNCNNPVLLSKISNSIISSYMINFQEIFKALIDEILQEEVIYLNALQAQYYVEKQEYSREKRRQQNIPNLKNSNPTVKQHPVDNHRKVHLLQQDIKTLKMMELVKGLDQLIDQ